MPDALIYRVGLQPGRSFYVLTHWTTGKDPRQGSLLSAAWMGGTREKDWRKRPSDCQLQKAQKKDWWGYSSCGLVSLCSCTLHTWHCQGPWKPSSCSTFTVNLLQKSCHSWKKKKKKERKKEKEKEKSCNYLHKIASVLSNTLWDTFHRYREQALKYIFWNNWPFPVLLPLPSFPNLLACWIQHFHSTIF